MTHLYPRLLTLLAILASVATVSAATITVTTLDNGTNVGGCSLRDAVDAANRNVAVNGCTAGKNADTIKFSANLGGGTALFTSGAIVVTDSLTIDGRTSESTQIRLNGDLRYRLFDVTSEVLTLTNLDVLRARGVRGSAVYVGPNAGLIARNVSFIRNEATGNAATEGGGAIYNDGRTVIEASTFDSNSASGTSGSGGAVFNNAGTLTVRTSSFSNNDSNRAGGAIEANGGTTTMVDVNFTSNRTGTNPGNGGAFHISGAGSATVRGGTVSRNTASSEGGGFWNNTGSMTIARTSFLDNIARGPDADNGGGAVYNNGGQVRMDTTTVSRNTATGAAGSGGGVLTNGGTLIVRSGTFTANTALRAGGAIEDAAGALTVITSTFSQNSVVEGANPGNGGAIHSGSGTTTTVSGGSFDANRAVEGGGIWTSGVLTITTGGSANAAATFTNNVATGNDADQGGGALYTTPSGTIVATGVEISRNVASGTSGSGGGVFSAGSLTLRQATLIGNTANRAGGGIEDANGTVVLEDVTLSTNAIGTAAPGNGGGLHSGGGDVTITGGLIENNVAVEGGGLWTNGTMTINGGAGDLEDDGDGNGDGIDDDGIDRSDDDDDAIDGDRSLFTIVRGNRATGADAGTGGGGIYVETGGEASVRYAVLDGNVASGTSGSGGGVLVADGAEARIAFSTIVENRANRAGGGIELFDDAATSGAATSVELRNVTIDGNRIATPMPGNGGGIHAGGAGAVTLRQTTVSNNRAREGGGIWISGSGSADIANSTVSGNTATEAGGGVYDNGGAAISIASSDGRAQQCGHDGRWALVQGRRCSS